MSAPERSRYQEYRDKRRGAPVRALQPCGSLAAARRHQRASEPLCEPCKLALRTEQARLYQQRRQQP